MSAWARSVLTCRRMRRHMRRLPGTSISWAHIRATWVQPKSLRAVTAGNSASRSVVVVNQALATSCHEARQAGGQGGPRPGHAGDADAVHPAGALAADELDAGVAGGGRDEEDQLQPRFGQRRFSLGRLFGG